MQTKFRTQFGGRLEIITARCLLSNPAPVSVHWRLAGRWRRACRLLAIRIAVLLASLIPLCSLQAGEGSSSDAVWMYVAGDGVELFTMDRNDGEIESKAIIRDAKPSFLAIHPNGKYLFGAGNELSSFAIDGSSGRLTFLNKTPSGGGTSCHLVVDGSGQFVLSASYGGGSVSVHRIEADGHIGEQTAFVQHTGSSVDPNRQEGPHAHSINLDAANRFAFAADLGLDKILIYRFDVRRGQLLPADPRLASVKPGAGPRHFSFHPTGRFAYVINELDSTITAFAYDSNAGRLREIETRTTLPADFMGDNYPAEIVVAPDGRHLYGSNRGQDAIAVFSIRESDGSLGFVQHVSTGGKWPRNFCIDPSGRFLVAANQQSDNVVVFRIDASTGKLTRTAHAATTKAPACIRFLVPPAS